MSTSRLAHWLTVLTLLLGALAPAPARAGLVIDQMSFHGKQIGIYNNRLENILDTGGLIYLFVRNTGPANETFNTVSLNGTDINTLYAAGTGPVKWWRAWPTTIKSGETMTVTIKGIDALVKEGGTLSAEVQSVNETRAAATAVMATPRLRLGAVVPSPDLKTVHVYVRNTETTQSVTLDQVYLNDNVTAQATFLGRTIAPGSLGIVKVAYAQAQPLLKALAVRVTATRQDGTPVAVGAPARLVEPWFPLGTWDSGLYGNVAGQQELRALQIDLTWTGGNFPANLTMYNTYFIRSVNSTTNPGSQATNPSIGTWGVADEPDAASPRKKGYDVQVSNAPYWAADPNHATYVNLCENRRYNEYANITDIIGVDHYSMYAQTNIAANGYRGLLPEALDLTEQLKDNSEPQRMWTWSQLVFSGSAWKALPDPWGVHWQFWAQVAGGAKGVLWFCMKPGNTADHPAQVNKAIQATREFSQVRGLCLFGDATRNVEVLSGGSKIIARAVMGEQAALLVVFNNNITYGGSTFTPTYAIAPQSGQVRLSLPAFITPQQVRRLSESGLAAAPNATVNGQQVTVDVNLGEDVQLYLIGAPDAAAPEAASGLQVAETRAGGAFVLSWKEPFDNFGVKGYKVYRNHVEIADVRYPLCVVSGQTAPGATSGYFVRAYDAAGNLGAQSNALGTLPPPPLPNASRHWGEFH